MYDVTHLVLLQSGGYCTDHFSFLIIQNTQLYRVFKKNKDEDNATRCIIRLD
jgi:hypothetical protein